MEGKVESPRVFVFASWGRRWWTRLPRKPEPRFPDELEAGTRHQNPAAYSLKTQEHFQLPSALRGARAAQAAPAASPPRPRPVRVPGRTEWGRILLEFGLVGFWVSDHALSKLKGKVGDSKRGECPTWERRDANPQAQKPVVLQ